MTPTVTFIVYTFGVAMLALGTGIVIGVGWRVLLLRRPRRRVAAPRAVRPEESRTMLLRTR